MINELFALLRQLAALVMLITLCDMLVPDGAMRRYTRLIGGLTAMLMLSTTLLSWLSGVSR
jgi:uncharacterized membrane protein